MGNPLKKVLVVSESPQAANVKPFCQKESLSLVSRKVGFVGRWRLDTAY